MTHWSVEMVAMVAPDSTLVLHDDAVEDRCLPCFQCVRSPSVLRCAFRKILRTLTSFLFPVHDVVCLVCLVGVEPFPASPLRFRSGPFWKVLTLLIPVSVQVMACELLIPVVLS